MRLSAARPPLMAIRRALNEHLAKRRVEFGIPSYNEGSGVIETLASVHHAAHQVGVPNHSIILSDSSDTSDTVEASSAWAKRVGAQIRIERSERRRSLKEALNNIFEVADAELLVVLVADVLIPASSLAHLLIDLTDPPQPDIAIGFAGPDPTFRALRYRASAWQMNLTRRIASRLPRDAIRSEGAFWGAWRSFYETYRFPIGSGSIHDDVELARHAVRNGLHARNSWRAEAYKVPAGTLEDFYIQTHRFFAANGEVRRNARDLWSATRETIADPVGGALYMAARAWSARRARGHPDTFGEQWPVTESTKRRP